VVRLILGDRQVQDELPGVALRAGQLWRQQLIVQPRASAYGDPLVPVLETPAGGVFRTGWWPWATTTRLTLAPLRLAPLPSQPPPAEAIRLSPQPGRDLQLGAYTLAHIPAARAVEITLYWRAERATERNYTVFLHLVGADGRPLAQADGLPCGGGCPTAGWPEGQWIVDRHRLSLPDGLAAGRYWLLAGLYDATSGQRLTGADGRDVVELGAIEIE
jgi:hypothetical protein